MIIKPGVPLFRIFACCRAGVFAAAVFCVSVFARSDLREHLGKVDFLTEYYFLQDMHHYFGQRNDYQDSAYLVSGYSELEAMLVSYDGYLHLGAMYSNYLGMGKQNDAITFDPRDAHYALVPFVEYRAGHGVFYQTGLDHRCFHRIDRPKSLGVPPYWNQIYLKVSSANYRVQQMKAAMLARDGSSWHWYDRLSWSVHAGYFMWQWFDTNRSIISGGHEWQWLASADIGYAFYKTDSWMFTARNKLAAYVDTTGTGYFEGAAGVDADIYNRKNTLGFFIDHYYEFPREMTFKKRGGMWAWGFRFRV